MVPRRNIIYFFFFAWSVQSYLKWNGKLEGKFISFSSISLEVQVFEGIEGNRMKIRHCGLSCAKDINLGELLHYCELLYLLRRRFL